MECTEAEVQAWRERQAYVCKLAKITPEHFGIRAEEVVRPDGAHDRNMLFIVIGAHQKFTLRIYDAQREFDRVRSEVFLLRELREAGFIVPDPVEPLDGSFAARVSLPEADDARHCVMYHWIEGAPVADLPIEDRSPGLVKKLGAELAQFHAFTEKMTVPDWFVAPSRDLQRLKEIIQERRVLHAPLRVLQSLRSVADVFERLGEGSRVFGLLHNDLNKGNLLFYQDKISFLDFTHFGWGFYVCDLAKMVDFGVSRSNGEELLKGYAEVRSLPDDVGDMLVVFRNARRHLRRWGWNWF